ncbi:uncharacterized protein LOC135351737 isoform X2 [Halichondria panicea]|uniref:uncharacterized protein LOC135351737 isoform X2 n=1 Tax=Halichondria panicea TaxID=6063 RepID=UPI00312B95AC
MLLLKIRWKTMKTFLTQITLLFILGTSTKAQQCGVSNLPPFSDPGGGGGAPRIQYRQQVLIPSYQFTCSGVVTQWGAYVEPGGDRDRTVYIPTFQVWRPDGNGNGVYTMVGENAYTSPITVIDSRLLVNALQPFIEFQPGDVVGYYLDSTRESDDRGVQLDVSSSNLEVYYGPPQEGNTFDTRADGVEVEDRRAPILLVTVGNTESNQLASALVPSLLLGLLLVVVSVAFLWYVIKNEMNKQYSQQDENTVTSPRRPSLYRMLFRIDRDKNVAQNSNPDSTPSNGNIQQPDAYSQLETKTNNADNVQLPLGYSQLKHGQQANGHLKNQTPVNNEEDPEHYSHLRDTNKASTIKLQPQPSYSHLETPTDGTGYANPTYSGEDAPMYTYIDVPRQGARLSQVPPTEHRYEGVAPSTECRYEGVVPPTEYRYEGVVPEKRNSQVPPIDYRYEGVVPPTECRYEGVVPLKQ